MAKLPKQVNIYTSACVSKVIEYYNLISDLISGGGGGLPLAEYHLGLIAVTMTVSVPQESLDSYPIRLTTLKDYSSSPHIKLP